MKQEEALNVLRALSYGARLTLLRALLEGEKCVRELVCLTQMRECTVSQHLARLKYAGVVLARREAQRIFYSLADKKIAALLRALERIYALE